MHDQDHEAVELSFTLARGQNQFFVELAEALVYELKALGVPASISAGEIPVPRKGLVHVFLPPHEYVSLSRHRPHTQLLKRSIVISAEQPESHYFLANLPLAGDAGSVFDINPRSVRAYRSRGIEATLLGLGYTRLWDQYESSIAAPDDGQVGAVGLPPKRDIDVLFLGRLTSRRAQALASYADVFERFRCHLGLSDNSRPNVETGAAFVAGEHKRSLLARSKVLLNVHGENEPYFEWLRVAEAVSAGCALVTEHSSDIAPLVPGQHLLTGRLTSLGLLCAVLVEDEGRRERMRGEAHELLQRERPLAAAARKLMRAAHDVDGAPVGRDLVLASRQERARGQFREESPTFEYQPALEPERTSGEALMLRALKHQMINAAAFRRQLARMEHDLRDGPTMGEPRTRIVAESAAWRSGAPRSLTVIVPLYNHRDDVLCALRSLARSSVTSWEVVVVDDASTDDGGDAVCAWIEAHEQLACRVVRHDLNRGLAAARNTGVEHARCDYLLMLDADNEVRRNAIGRLMEALRADRAASFAYGIMERFNIDGPEGLLSAYGWDPQRLRAGNYIDAFALIRREALEAMGGYSHDARLYGWEDYDLWVRMAEAGRHGAFVPEIIARYRVGHSSMISHTNLSTSDAFAALADHAPGLMAGLQIPR